MIEKDETPTVDAQNRSDNRGRPFGDVRPSNPTWKAFYQKVRI